MLLPSIVQHQSNPPKIGGQNDKVLDTSPALDIYAYGLNLLLIMLESEVFLKSELLKLPVNW